MLVKKVVQPAKSFTSSDTVGGVLCRFEGSVLQDSFTRLLPDWNEGNKADAE